MQLFERFEMFSNCFFPHCIGQLNGLPCALFYTLRFGFGSVRFWSLSVLRFSIFWLLALRVLTKTDA